MSLKSTLRFILNHPLNRDNKINALTRFLKWQLYSRLYPHPMILPYAEKSKLMVWRGLTGATGNIYCGLHEFDDMAFVLHFLRSTDTFIDIGANVGSYTILGAREAGARTFSFEPIPGTFDILESNVSINKVHKLVTTYNIGLGSQKGALKFTKSYDTVNHVVLDDTADTISVPIDRFDNIIKLETPALMKIDVEGFETEVLNGMPDTLADKNLYAIIIELTGVGARYGFSEDDIHKKLLSYGFSPYTYAPFERRLTALNSYGSQNTIYIRDADFVNDRLRTARKFKILGREI